MPRCGRSGWPTSSVRSGCASSCRSCSMPPRPAAGHPTTCCSPARPGSGKTTLAMIIAGELGAPLRITSGPAIERAGDLAALLSTLSRGRGALPRRDPPDGAPGRGDALRRHGGLPGRRGRRQGSGRHRDPARRRPVHAGRRDHPGRDAPRAASRPVRLRRPTWTSTPPRSSSRCCDAAPRCSGSSSTPTARPRSAAGRAVRRGSPTGCCAGSGTSPRFGPTAWSPGRWLAPHSPSTRSTSSASTGSTRRCSRP